MTEKRYSFNWERGHPNFWDNYCDLADCYLTCEDVVDKLNEYDEEIVRLKEDIQIALNWYRHLPQHLMRYEDVKASHRLECYIKEQGDKEK